MHRRPAGKGLIEELTDARVHLRDGGCALAHIGYDRASVGVPLIGYLFH